MFLKDGPRRSDRPRRSDEPRRRPPLFLGCITIKHDGCWASDTTREFPTITIEIAVTGYDVESYELYAIIKPKTGVFDERQQDEIRSFINQHQIIENGVAIFQNDEILVMQLRVIDRGGPRGVIRPITIHGAIMTEICHHIEDGIEHVWAVYEKPEDFEKCIETIEFFYNEGALIKSEIAKSPGLESTGLTRMPNLFSEQLFCGKEEFTELRKMTDFYLKGQPIPTEVQENWPSRELYEKSKNLLIKAAKAKEYVSPLLKILMPDFPDI